MSGVIVKCKRGDGKREADPISDSLITSDFLAAKRGKRFLDDPEQGGYYKSKRISLRVPHKGGHIVRGDFITINDGKLGYSNVLARVENYSISINYNSVWANIEAVVYAD